MTASFSTEEISAATSGRWLQRGPARPYAGVSTDSRALDPGCLFVALSGERFDAHEFLRDAAQRGAAGAVVQRGRALPPLPKAFGLIEVDDTLAALGRLAAFHRRRFQIPIGAVTGSNGKTTTKELVGAILGTRGKVLKTTGNLNNEVGVPLTLLGLDPSHVAAVVEMGMNHPGEIGRLTAMARPDAGLITVVQPAHLGGLGTLEGVAEAKGELFFGLAPDRTAVVNLDDPRIVAVARRAGRAMVTFGRAPDAEVRLAEAQSLGTQGLELSIAYRSKRYRVVLPLLGMHNAQNGCGAFALGVALGIFPEDCVTGLERARAFPRRLNVLSAPGGVTVIDDCYNANPASMQAALSTLADLSRGGRGIAVLGDMLELGNHEEAEHVRLGERAVGSASLVAFFGPRSAAGAKAAASLGDRVGHFLEIDALLAWLRPQLAPGDVVLVKGSRGMKLERVVDGLSAHALAREASCST